MYLHTYCDCDSVLYHMYAVVQVHNIGVTTSDVCKGKDSDKGASATIGLAESISIKRMVIEVHD